MTSRNSPSDPPDPAEVVSASVPQTLPSTRAGGQDDVSSNKLPQIKIAQTMCKLINIPLTPIGLGRVIPPHRVRG